MLLHWYVNEAQLTFDTSDRDEVLDLPESFDGCYFIWGALHEYINSTSDQDRYCYSTLTITPGMLNKDSDLSLNRCSLESYSTLTITCGASGNTTKSLMHEIAGIILIIERKGMEREYCLASQTPI